MQTLYDAEFIEISLTVFQRMTGVLPFDIFIRRAADTYTKLFARSDVLDQQRLANYELKKKIHSLYVQQKDYRQYLFYVEKVASSFFVKGNKATPDELLSVIKEMVDLTMLEIVVHMRVDQESVTHATSTIKGCLDMLHKDPKSLVKLLKMMAKHQYTIKHSVATGVFAILLSQMVKIESEKTLTTVGLGALLHDIGMSQLSFDAEDKQELTAEELRDVHRHPEFGKRMLDGIKNISHEVRNIVLQHHEQPNGHGYPNNLRDKEIFLPAKIVAIADTFSALISKRPYRDEPFSPLRALEIMLEDRGKFDPVLLKTFSDIFIKIKSSNSAA